MIHNRIKIVCEIEVNLDGVPGWGDNPEDFVNSLRRIVVDSWKHYHPTVKVDHTEPLLMVTYGGPDNEQTWVFSDEQEAIDKHTELVQEFINELKEIKVEE